MAAGEAEVEGQGWWLDWHRQFTPRLGWTSAAQDVRNRLAVFLIGHSAAELKHVLHQWERTVPALGQPLTQGSGSRAPARAAVHFPHDGDDNNNPQKRRRWRLTFTRLPASSKQSLCAYCAIATRCNIALAAP